MLPGVVNHADSSHEVHHLFPCRVVQVVAALVAPVSVHPLQPELAARSRPIRHDNQPPAHRHTQPAPARLPPPRSPLANGGDPRPPAGASGVPSARGWGWGWGRGRGWAAHPRIRDAAAALPPRRHHHLLPPLPRASRRRSVTRATSRGHENTPTQAAEPAFSLPEGKVTSVRHQHHLPKCPRCVSRVAPSWLPARSFLGAPLPNIATGLEERKTQKPCARTAEGTCV